MFEHPAVSKSWLTYRVSRHDEGDEGEEGEQAFRIETVLNVQTVGADPTGNHQEWDELIDALTDFLSEHEDIDGVEIIPPA